MKEGCPLGRGQVWDARIPKECRGCIEDAINDPASVWTDKFDPDCKHELEFGGESLHRITGSREGDGKRRLYGVLEICSKTDTEVLTDMTEFWCTRGQEENS